MYKFISYGLLSFILCLNQAFTQSTVTDQLLLNLNEGDSFSYAVKSSKSFLLAYPKDSVLRSDITRSKHTFHVVERKSGNRYILRYKIEYEISEHRSDSEVSIKEVGISDSRFPQFSNRLNDVAACFLNTVEYMVLFAPLENSMQVLNREEINKNLLEYMEERGIGASEYTKRELSGRDTDYGIAKRMLFLNFYPDGGDIHQNWQIDQITDETESFTLMGEHDTTLSILSTLPYSGHSEETGLMVGKSMKLIKRMQIHRETGLIQSAATATYLFPDSIKTEAIYRGRSDITDFRSTVELVDFSRWRKPTVLAGEIRNPTARKLCLVSLSSIVGSDHDYQYFELDDLDRFSLKLNLKDAKRYRLYYLKKYPARINPSIELYIEPGDNIYIDSDFSSIEENITFSGKGCQNSEFLNGFYQKYNEDYLRFLESARGLHYTISFRKTEDWGKIVEIIPEMTDYLEDQKIVLSQGFYDYWKFAISCISDLASIVYEYNDYMTLGKDRFESQRLFKSMPDTLNPMYKFHTNINEFNRLVGVHSMSQNGFIVKVAPELFYSGYNRTDELSFAKMIFSGYPLYVEFIRQMEASLRFTSTQYYLQTPRFQSLVSGCNNQEVRDYIIARYDAFSKIQKGNDMPEMEIVGMDGNKMNWRNTKNKVIILMLYNEYTKEQLFCKELYTDFGKNQKDVMVLRISPGNDFNSWKGSNEIYTDSDYQMYFTAGESAFKDQFLFLDNNYGLRYLIIGKDGKIFTNPARHELKREIEEALNEDAPPNEFLKALWYRALPGTLLGIVLTFVFYRIVNRRRFAKYLMERKMAELEQKAIKAQLNPHFLFNCLNSIQNLIRTDRRNEADRYLSKFAVLIRQVLKNSEKEEISISEELKGLEWYLELEQMRFNFDYEILPDEGIDIHNVMIPPMLLHPIVENAILHGLDPKEGDKKLTVGIHESGQSIQFLIEDNGVGRDPELTRDSSDESRGLKLMEARMEILRKSSQEDYNFKITDKKDQFGNSAGTCVEILIPDEK